MKDTRWLATVGIVLVACFGVLLPSVEAEGVSLLQAIEKVEQETKMLVVKAASAGGYHRITAIGDGKTKMLKVCADTGKIETTEEKDWSEKSKEIFAKAKIKCSALATSAMNHCAGALQSLKARLADGNVTYVVCVKNEKKGALNATVCACTGRVGAVESAEEAAEGCE